MIHFNDYPEPPSRIKNGILGRFESSHVLNDSLYRNLIAKSERLEKLEAEFSKLEKENEEMKEKIEQLKLENEKLKMENEIVYAVKDFFENDKFNTLAYIIEIYKNKIKI